MSPTLPQVPEAVNFFDFLFPMVYYIGMTDNQCKTCNLSAENKALTEGWINQGLGNKEISHRLYEKGIAISRDSIRRHRNKHMHGAEIPVDAPKTLLGVVEPPKSNANIGTAYVNIGENGGEVVTREYTDDENPEQLIQNTDQILKEHRVDPEFFQIVGTIGMSRYLQGDVWKTSYRFRIEPKKVESAEDQVDLPLLYSQVMSRTIPDTVRNPDANDDVLVVAFSDAQIGKVDARGGTEALIARFAKYMDDLETLLIEKKYTKAIFADVGDVIEGFENTAGQMNSNDRSIMDQVDLAITMEEEMISLLRRYCEHVSVTVIPSNHAAWRRMKDYLGTPADDWGIFSMKQIERLYKHLEVDNVTFFYPKPYMKSVCIPVGDYNLGVAHGDAVNNPDQMHTWWAKQVHGGMPLAAADVLLTGHYHHYRVAPSGRQGEHVDPELRQKWWLQAPTLDNGSSWFANRSYGDCDPGLLTFVMNEKTGFDLQSIRIL